MIFQDTNTENFACIRSQYKFEIIFTYKIKWNNVCNRFLRSKPLQITKHERITMSRLDPVLLFLEGYRSSFLGTLPIRANFSASNLGWILKMKFPWIVFFYIFRFARMNTFIENKIKTNLIRFLKHSFLKSTNLPDV